jgi:hypothetical protein
MRSTDKSTPSTFRFADLERNFTEVLENGYRVIACEEYLAHRRERRTERVLVNRVDIDVSCKKARRLARIFNALGIRASFFVRLHAEEYNPFAFENYRCLKYIRDSGHEIGYHSEVMDEAAIWDESAEACLRRDVDVLGKMLGVVVRGIASHGGMTGINNLDFWRDRKPSDFGLLYEAYDSQPEFGLFHNSLYVSDSEWTQWKCYDKGVLRPGDTRPLGEHSRDAHSVLYSLIHPETYYDEHFYE